VKKADPRDAIETLLEFGLTLEFEDLPPAVVARTKLAVLDTLGAAIAGIRGESVAELSSLVCGFGGSPQATLISNGRKLPLPLAVLVNATAARAWDLDDVHEQNTCHVSASLVPAALAVCEARGPVSGKDLITAIAVAAELICRMSAAPRISPGETGSSLSYQCAFYAVALMASRLMKLSDTQSHDALGIAHARAAGNQQGLLQGTMTVRLMQGVAAEGGIMSALMAERNISGSRAILEGRFGYYYLFQRGQYEPNDLTGQLRDRWLFNEVSVKPLYPCCKFIHGPIDALLSAMRTSRIPASGIEKLHVTVTNRDVYDLVCTSRERKWNPSNITDAQFSLPYILAWAAIHDGVGFSALSSRGLNDSRVREMMSRIDVTVETGLQADGRGKFPMPGIVTVTEKSGKATNATVEYVKGHPKNPMSFGEVAEKFRDCARFGRPDWNNLEEVVQLVAALETSADAGKLVGHCAHTIAA